MERTKLLMATMNRHKLEEAWEIFTATGLSEQFELLCMADIGFTGEIPEEEETLEGNARSKAKFVRALNGMNCFSDDTGLEVDALGGAPGVHSARYAGPECNAADNIEKLLKMMENVDHPNRTARFRTVISLIMEGNEFYFEGVVEGEILTATEGDGGFGYDPVFRPTGYEQSFATMPLEVKNRISHRGRALEAMAEFLLSKRLIV
jgi:XTP/dITP diphosphohydrolase